MSAPYASPFRLVFWLVAFGDSLLPLKAPAAPVPAQATYDVVGRLTSLLQGGEKLPVEQCFELTFTGGVRVPLPPENRPPSMQREGTSLRWRGSARFPNGGTATLATDWTEDDAGVTLDATLSAPSALDTQAVDAVLDLPRAPFAGGRLEAAGSPALDLPVAKPAEVVFFHATTDALIFTSPGNDGRTLTLRFDGPRPVTVADRWDAEGRSFRVRVGLHAGEWASGETIRLRATLRLAGPGRSAPAVRLHIDPAQPRYTFDGYGGNFCWGEQPAVDRFLLDELAPAWTRHELKARDWERERDHPGPALVHDFEQMRTVQGRHIPWILSVWNLPQRFYADANQRPPDQFFHPVSWDRWDDLLDLVGSYLLYLKKNYGAEPDLFSFNEPDLGIYVGLTPEAHRDAIKRLGAHFARLGLKTRLLLGDTSDARDTHRYVLPVANDPEALRYVGALSFHAWRDTTAAQYAAWADMADWLRLPLLVAEAGVDPDAYYNHAFDQFDYGLAEAAQQQRLLRFARPVASLFWQYTTDYGLVHVRPDGGIEPTGRFWLLRHFAVLTPRHSRVLGSGSDQDDVLVSAFRREDAWAVHVLNLGPARTATLDGLPPGPWKTTTTTETTDFAEGTWETGAALALPARGLVTLTR